jgi:hypothetical protein
VYRKYRSWHTPVQDLQCTRVHKDECIAAEFTEPTRLAL